MPDGHGLRCFRVRIECSSGRVLAPIIAAADGSEAKAKALVLAEEMCRQTPLAPSSTGAHLQRPDSAGPPRIGSPRRVHRWWSA